jgi:predicted MPP superfamily phosphohydrolase
MNSLLKIIIIFVVVILFLVIYSYYENRNLEITNYNIQSIKIPETFHGKRFLVLADLHNNHFGKNNETLRNKISETNPDYIIVAGDMIVSKKNLKDNLITLNFLVKLSKNYKIYYAFGNHEQRLMKDGEFYDESFDDFQKELKEAGVQFLKNESCKLYYGKDSISITGLFIHSGYFNKIHRPPMNTEYLQNIVGIPDKKCYNILIAHNPVYFKSYIDWGADLVLSGHIHGGIVRLPGLGGVISPQYKLFPRYDAGQFMSDGKIMLVSRGLGMHTIKLRLFNRPELMVVTMERKL